MPDLPDYPILAYSLNEILAEKVQLDDRAARNARYRIKTKIDNLRQLLPLLTEKGILTEELRSLQTNVSANEDKSNLIKGIARKGLQLLSAENGIVR
ncbi:MAG: hypothetical protein AB1351_06965 [Thermoproteota archaeon]